jgi:NitT/TauT family transport system substrate-binding protein
MKNAHRIFAGSATVVLAAVFLVFGAGCSKSAAGKPAAAGEYVSRLAVNPEWSVANGVPPWQGYTGPRTKIRASWYKGMTGIGNQFALYKGFYQDAGFDLDLINITNPVDVFAAGEVDVADGDPSTYIPAIVNGVPIKIISSMWRNRGAYWFIVRPEITTWADLKGKKIGTGGAVGGMRLTIREVLRLNGIDPDTDVELVAAGLYQTAYAAFVSRAVDATVIHNPYAVVAETEGTGRAMARTWDYLPDYHTGVLVATQKLIDEQPEVVERLLQVYFYGNEYAKNHPEEFFPWAAEYLNLDPAVAKAAIEADSELWEDDPIVDINRLQVTQNLLTQHKMQRESFPVGNVVDNRFAEQVAKTLKLGKYKE